MQTRRIEARPEMISGEPQFFRCNQCGNLIIQENLHKPEIDLHCCGTKMLPLVPNTSSELAEEHIPVITFKGGFERGGANVKIGKNPHPMTEDHHIEWVYLRTTEGGQLKRLKRNIKPETNFAFADDDTYAYCSREICWMGIRHCNFKCKRGFTAYIYCNQHGLWKKEM